MSINDEWVRYLRAEGYLGNINDMLRTALQAEAASSYKNLNDLWVAYLTSEGYTGNINDMMYQWLGAKGYTGSLNDRLLQALKADDIFLAAPVGCVITLTTDIATLFGISPMVVSGQTASFTQVSPAENAAASTDYITKTSPPVSGIILIEADINITGTASGQAAFGDVMTQNSIQLTKSTAGYAADITVSGVTTNLFTGDTVEGQFAFGYGSDGSLYLYKDGVAYDTSLAAALLPSGAFMTASVLAVGGAGDTVSVSFVANGADMSATYTDLTLRDWCGNDTVPKFDPASLFGVGDVGDYWDFTDISTLYQDTSKLSPVTADGEPVGAAVGLRGTLDLTQGTTTSKPEYIDGVGLNMNPTTTRRFLDTSVVIPMINSSLGASGRLATTITSQPLVELASSTTRRIICGHPTHGSTSCSWISSSAASKTFTGPGLATDYSVVVCHDGGSDVFKSLYTNTGELDSTAAVTMVNNSVVFQIGKNQANSTVRYSGRIYRAFFIDRALSDTEMRKIGAWLDGSY